MNSCAVPLRRLVLLMVVPPLALRASSLSDALDGPGIVSATSSSTPAWFGEDVPANARDSVDAARSGALNPNGQSTMTATVTGPGTLRFWWKVSSERTYDFAWWRLDGSPQLPMSGESGWQEVTAALTPGNHTVEWFYQKDSTVTAGSDALWVDQLRVVAPVSTTLQQALDLTAPQVSVMQLGGLPWNGWGAPYANHDGVDAARSGQGSQSALALLVNGPGIFSAWTMLNPSGSSNNPWLRVSRLEFGSGAVAMRYEPRRLPLG